MSIKLNGATSGSVELDVPDAIGSDLSVTIPATAGDIVVKGTDGSVDLGDVNIDSGGRLLVGTSSAFTGLGQVPKFFLATTNSVEGDIGIGQFASTNYGAHLDLIRSNSGTIGQATGGAIPTNNTIGNIRFIGSDSVTFRQGAGITALADQLWASGDCPTRLVFSTTADGASSPTERMRIDNTGQVIIKAPDSSTTSVFFALQHNNGVGKVQLDMGGNVRAVTTSGIQPIVSERRLKTNIDSIDLDQAWTNAKDIPWRTFEYLDNLGTEYTGHIVDEVEAVDPSLILPTDQVDDQGTIRTYDNAKLNAMRFVALQEALKRIEALEAEVTALKGGAS